VPWESRLFHPTQRVFFSFLLQCSQVWGLHEVPSIQELLAKCFIAKDNARSTLVEIGQKILESFTSLTYQLSESAMQSTVDAETVIEIKRRLLEHLSD
jgi:hypothetical protein